MATKTTSKTAAKKSAPRKTAAAKTSAPAKSKVAVKKKPEPVKSAAHVEVKKPAPPPAPKRNVESVSLIDKQPAAKKSEDGELKKKTTVLPPISRIRASMEAPPAPPPP